LSATQKKIGIVFVNLSIDARKSQFKSIFARDLDQSNKKKWHGYNEKLKRRLSVAFRVLLSHFSQFYLENFFA
jgi:hypothetical protein